MIRPPETWLECLVAAILGVALAATLVFGPGGLLP